jgi:hypothetical protein
VRRAGQVAWREHRLAAGLLYPAGGLAGVVVLVKVGDEHACSWCGLRAASATLPSQTASPATATATMTQIAVTDPFMLRLLVRSGPPG